MVLVVALDLLLELLDVELDVALDFIELGIEDGFELGGLVLEAEDDEGVVGDLLVHLEDVRVDFL